MLSFRHSIGNASPLESLARTSKSVPHLHCYATPPPTESCARIVLEDHIQKERERREYPILYVTFEYLVILCLRFILRHEPRQLAIYHPDDPDNSHTRKLYTTCCLLMKLRELKAEVKDCGLDITESSIDIPSEMTTCPYPVCISPFLDTYSPLPPLEQEDSTNVKSA